VSFFLHAALIVWAICVIAAGIYRLALTHAPPPEQASKYVQIYDVRDMTDRWVALQLKLVWVHDKPTANNTLFSDLEPPPGHLRPATPEEFVRDIGAFIEHAVQGEDGDYIIHPEILDQTAGCLIIFCSPVMQKDVENALRELRLSDRSYPVPAAGH
jgi:hypothetical protein